MQQWDFNGGSTDEKRSWFAVQVRERWEQQIADALTARNIETFLPLATVRRRWSDRLKTITTALFPGYLFCRVDPARRLPVLTVPGVHYLAGCGHTPEPVPDPEIESLQTVMRSGLAALSRPYFSEGDRVRIWEGPLRGVEGVLLEVANGLELVVSINILQRSVAVVIDAAWVLPAGLDAAYVHATPAMPAGRRL
jgi:transcription termination/antitermination protein NusG